MAEQLQYTVKYANRTTIGIHITEEAKVEIRAPYGTDEATIRRVLNEKREWIRKAVEKVVDRNHEKALPSDRYFDGALFPLHGGAVELHVKEVEGSGITTVALHPDYRQNILSIRGSNMTPERVQAAVNNWGRKYAKAYLAARVDKFAQRIGVTYNHLTIRETKTRWGSCSSDGNLNLHWKLILLTERLSDYVIVHELCHRIELNHSKEFWAQVEKVLPDYKERRKGLKDIEQRILSW